jgi:HEAT repeat protein
MGKKEQQISNFIFIFSCCTCFGLYPSGAVTKPALTQTSVLSLGSRGAEVQVVQIQLKALGYYKNVLDGNYNSLTQDAVVKFQKATKLKRMDGITDLTTRIALGQSLASPTKCVPPPQVIPPSPSPQLNLRSWSWLGLLALGITGGIIYLIKRLSQGRKIPASYLETQNLLTSSPSSNATLQLNPAENVALSAAPEVLSTTKNYLLPTLHPVDELVQQLNSTDPTKRRIAIWNLGQHGDSRAVQPLIDLMINADSQQHGLILSALAEISARTLKPMKRALSISMQAENPQVRQNAIRDLVRICDMMGQLSYILRHALEDTDPEVQATARYALNHLSHFRLVIDQQVLPDSSHPGQN